MNGTGKWIGGSLLAILGLFGLGMSARSDDAAFALFGMLLFVFAIVVIFRLITITTASGESH